MQKPVEEHFLPEPSKNNTYIYTQFIWMKKSETRAYERQVKIDNFDAVHAQIKKYAVPHSNGTISQYLFKHWMDYYRYSQCKARNKLPISYVVKLHNLGIVFDDSILQVVFPWSKV